MLVDFRRLLPCAERFYVFLALLPANMQAALSGRNARRKALRVAVFVGADPPTPLRTAEFGAVRGVWDKLKLPVRQSGSDP
jgi:hypothetical protein